MKAKLIKVNDYYYLRESYKTGIGGAVCERTLGTTNSQGELGKLSKKNCDEIFGVTDVEKLAEEDCSIHHPYHPVHDQTTRATFIRGFKKAMELNKDKLFTLKDMYDAVMLGVCFEDPGIQGISTYEELKELAIKRASKPTEIEVEIEMEEEFIFDPAMGISQGYYSDKPKLDSQGCLILKKI